jgi:hypothetical protein
MWDEELEIFINRFFANGSFSPPSLARRQVSDGRAGGYDGNELADERIVVLCQPKRRPRWP